MRAPEEERSRKVIDTTEDADGKDNADGHGTTKRNGAADRESEEEVTQRPKGIRTTMFQDARVRGQLGTRHRAGR